MSHRLVLALSALAALAVTAATAAAAPGGNRLYEFRGDVAGVSSSSLQITVEGGNHDALKALLGQSQTQSFAVGSSTHVLRYLGRRAEPATLASFNTGDPVVVRVRASKDASLSTIEGQPADSVVDRAPAAPHTSGPLFLYVGIVSGAQPDDHVTLTVSSGNWRALHTMLGQSLGQTFTTDTNTIYLDWQDGHSTVIDPSQLKAGDRITVRVHAAKDSTLAQVESTPAAHVGDHEPGNPETESDSNS